MFSQVEESRVSKKNEKNEKIMKKINGGRTYNL
jgi:hypothetical protein